ncbi:hypothetical protein [Paracoccus zhejiangensis]|uniref:NfeD-like C-terminal domain-containing protein n=1 Tax=Paracoccus zhejiangensis TaxID=1077935 RepID=A0A2H5F2P0_9RHOB|nr:hypothetical protein [Paracoccus zhejiangensis]AUH65811.1 hypothetical protein CX676_17945 [Paracoccus zhejiangensis]
MNWENGWLWLIAALVLALLELLVPAWAFLGVAIAVALMGLVLLIGLWSGGLPMALVVTAILSGLIWYLLRRLAGVRKDQVRVWDRDINDND